MELNIKNIKSFTYICTLIYTYDEEWNIRYHNDKKKLVRFSNSKKDWYIPHCRYSFTAKSNKYLTDMRHLSNNMCWPMKIKYLEIYFARQYPDIAKHIYCMILDSGLRQQL